MRNTYGDEQIGNLSLVLRPGFTVLIPAALDVTQGTVGDHAREEDGVEPREWAAEAGNQAPVQGKIKIACVVDLTSFAVCGESQHDWVLF